MTTVSQREFGQPTPIQRAVQQRECTQQDSAASLSPTEGLATQASKAEVSKELTRSWYWMFLLGIPVLAILAFAIFQPIVVLPRMGLGPGFGLTEGSGQRLTNEDLRGTIVLYNFTYTSCATPCPQTTPVMAEIHDLLDEMNLQTIPVALVTISFDPERDGPTVLSAYAQRFIDSADRAAAPWYFVTGDPLPLKYVIGGGFGSYYQANNDGTFTFDPTFVLVDGAGIIRAKYRTATPDIATMQRDIELVAKEAVESTGATRLAYEAAHLFLCYPK
ncbi:MAG: SCO family protein [Caldilineaceae bacterium]|nr:SCO family protein [Caldilineaceae bacterium]